MKDVGATNRTGPSRLWESGVPKAWPKGGVGEEHLWLG